MGDILLEIKDLETWFYTEDGIVKGCDKVSYKVNKGETLAVVGESGSGKSVTAMSILNLIPDPPGKIVDGQILFQGQNLVGLPLKEMQRIRGNRIAMIFQEPMTSLNPVMTAGRQVMESIRLHQNSPKKEARAKAVELLELVGISDAKTRMDEYPHMMSGGMKQRIMIAIALACRPKLLIADEPTSALDVTIQAQILNLIKDLQKELSMAVIMITHDMGVVAETADKVATMYAGKIVEYGTAHDIFYNARHPYLEGLKKCIPGIDDHLEELSVIKGIVPDPLNLPKGCRFEPRCDKSLEICRSKLPPKTYFGDEHYTCCWLYGEQQ